MGDSLEGRSFGTFLSTRREKYAEQPTDKPQFIILVIKILSTDIRHFEKVFKMYSKSER